MLKNVFLRKQILGNNSSDVAVERLTERNDIFPLLSTMLQRSRKFVVVITSLTTWLSLRNWTRVILTEETANTSISVETVSAVEEKSPSKPYNTRHKAKLHGLR
jgi:hypothetical protein